MPAQVSKEGSSPKPDFELDHAHIPDPLGEAFDQVLNRQLELEATVEGLQDRLEAQTGEEGRHDHSNIGV